MMPRVPEQTELMDEGEQAEAYAVADFAAVNQGFVEAFNAAFPDFSKGGMVDLGCGPADIPLRMAKKLPGVHVTGVDGAEAMLAHGRAALVQAGLQERVTLLRGVLPGAVYGPFDAVISNSLLHHLTEPRVLWEEIGRIARKGAPIYVMDLMRPESEAAAQSIVETYSGNEREVLKRDFFASLCAAFTTAEVRQQLEDAGLAHLEVKAASDRHLTVVGRR